MSGDAGYPSWWLEDEEDAADFDAAATAADEAMDYARDIALEDGHD